MSTRPIDGPSKPDKELWPGVTKRQLWDYLGAVGDRLLAHAAGRPLTLKRFPDGIDGTSFFSKDLPRWAPDDIERFEEFSESAGKTVSYAVARSVADLQWMGHIAALELHQGAARVDKPERPAYLVVDLDPGETETDAAWAALTLKQVLDAMELPSVVKTSGKRGLHVLVPVERRYSSSELRGLTLAIGKATTSLAPDRLTVQMRKAERKGRLLVDWSRNGSSQTIVCAWSPRATPEATVSMPVTWDEVAEGIDPAAFTVATAPDRDDAWAEWPSPVRLEQARDALAEQGYDAEDQSPRARTR